MPSWRTVSVGLAITGACLGAIWRCSVYDDTLLAVTTTDGGGSDAPPDSPFLPDAWDGCNHARWPARPAADDDASVQNIEFYNALSYLDFGLSNLDGGPVPALGYGLDLDNTCTCPGPDSCIPFGEAGTQCDLEGGVDNATGRLLKEFSGQANFFNQDLLNSGISAGVYGAVIQVRGYNGQANDTQVQVAFFISNGTVGVGTDAGPSKPNFDGNDVWTLDPDSLGGGVVTDAGPEPNVTYGAYDLNAYVSDNTLVANLTNFPLSIGAANSTSLITIQLTGAKVVAKLRPFGNSFQMKGVVAGRWNSSRLLTAMQVLHDPFDHDASLCGDDAIYQLLKPRICSIQDVTSNVGDDGKNVACDALSLGFAFTMVPARYGPAYGTPDAGGGGCGPLWTDQCQD